jgi:DNA-binding MltR family transcriptional regulator
MEKNPFDDAPPEIKRLSFFLQSFYAESDRGAALMSASMLDELLKEVISKFLVKSSKSKALIEGFNAPLGTFHARILASYSLGLIEDVEFKEVEIIRKVRNMFGHSWTELSFDSDVVKNEIEKFPFQEETPRTTFNHTVANLLGELLWRTHYVEKERRITKQWPNKSGFLKR